MKRPAAILVSVALLALFCVHPVAAQEGESTSAVPQQQELAGAPWQWTGTLMNDGSRTTVPDPNRYLLTFLDGGRVTIQADCNRILGTYTTEEHRITITPGPSTLAACPPDSLGTVFVNQLGNIASYFFRDGNLVLEIKFDSGSMTFVSGRAELADTAWDVVNFNNGRQALVSLLAETEISLNFGADGRLSGSAGCNQYTGGYQSSGGKLTVGTLAATSMMCHTPDGVMEQEAQYLAALSTATSYEIAGDRVTIRDADGAMLLVAKSIPPAALAGTSWDVTNLNNGREAVVGTITGTRLTIDFDDDNGVSGNAGCNTFNGSYELVGHSLTIGPLATTRMNCSSPEGVLEQERQFITALQNSTTFELNGRTLTIRDEGGAMQVVANAKNTP